MSSSIATLTHGPISLRPVRVRDSKELESILLGNRAWLQPWEATNPGGSGRWDVRGGVRSLLSQASAGTALPYVITYEGRLAGQLTVSSISHGALSSASLGYWVAHEFAGRGIAPTATALAIDYALHGMGLHRMEICIRPENAKSLRIVQKLGLRYEGLRRRYIHIDGDWRDHFCFGVVREEAPGGVLRRWVEGRADPEAAAVPERDWTATRAPLR